MDDAVPVRHRALRIDHEQAVLGDCFVEELEQVSRRPKVPPNDDAGDIARSALPLASPDIESGEAGSQFVFR
jgi:hypothetical protein